MEKFVTHEGLVATMDRSDVDTDQIIPKQFLKRIERTGFGQFLFNDWRFDKSGEPRPDFELNQPENEGASILVARRDFGTGSSREHAVWALADFGFKSIIAESFGDIFYNNSFKNGVLPIRCDEALIDQIFANKESNPQYKLTIDLENTVVTDGDNLKFEFEIDSFRRHNLLNGLDDIGLTLQHEEKITRYEKQLGIGT